MQRRDFLTGMLAGTAPLRLTVSQAQAAQREVYLERAAAGAPPERTTLLGLAQGFEKRLAMRRLLQYARAVAPALQRVVYETFFDRS